MYSTKRTHVRHKLAVGLSGSIAAALLIPATPAVADTKAFTDAVGDTQATSDFRRMEVTNSGDDNQFRVRVAMSEIVLGTSLTVYVDRNRENAGPELRMVAYPDSEWSLFRVSGWGERGDEIQTCGNVRYSTSSANPVAVWTATRTCLNIQPKVRVAAKLVDPDHGRDWIPAKQTLSAPVAATS